MKLNIRSGNENDVQGILELRKEMDRVNVDDRPDLFTEEGSFYTKEDVIKVLESEKNSIFVVESITDRQLVAYSIIEIQFTEQHKNFRERVTLVIQDMCIKESSRGKGVGQLLFDSIISFGKENNADALELDVFSENDLAIQFFESNGMRDKTRRMELELK